MTLDAADYFVMFWSSFFAVFLLGLQSKNVNQSRYMAAVITSFGISVSQFTFVKYAANGSYDVFGVTAVGGCAGIACSIWFYKSFMEGRRSNGRN